MALVANGTIDACVKRTGNMPAWATFTALGFFKVPSDTNQTQIIANFGATDGFLSPRIDADGTTMSRYNERGTYGSLSQALTMAKWYGLDYTVSGTAATLRLIDPDDGSVVASITGTHTSSTSPLTMAEFWLGDYHYSGRSNCKYAGWRLWNRVLTTTERATEYGSLSAVSTTDLKGDFPMDDTASKANCLIDASGNGNLVETGTSFTVDSDLPSLAPDPAVLTGATTFAGMTSAGTGAVAVQGSGATTFDGMTSTGLISVGTTGTQAITFDGMTSAGTGTVAVAGVGATTFAGMTSAGVIDVTDAPSPEPAPSTNFANTPPRRQRIGVRIDGRLYFVSYQEAAEIIARQAEEDARRQRAEKSRKAAKAAARIAAQNLRSRVTIEQPLDLDGVDMSIVADRMFRDLREVYSQQLIQSLLHSNLQRKHADDEAAMAAAEMLLMDG